MRGQLFGAGFVGAMRESKEKVIAGFADVASIERAGRDNLQDRRIEAGDRRPDRLDFALAAGRSGPGEDRAAVRKHRSVFDKRRVGVTKIGLKHGERKSAIAQRLAIGGMLLQDAFISRSAEIDGGQSFGKIGARQTNDSVLKQSGFLFKDGDTIHASFDCPLTHSAGVRRFHCIQR